MNTLIQIESAVTELPRQEQWSLLSWLQTHLSRSTVPTTTEDSADRQNWLEELAKLRAQTHTGSLGVPAQQLMDELREDRC